MNRQEIAVYEELQINAFPALQPVLYDGWAVRFGGGFTYRVNCAGPVYPEVLNPADKIRHVEQLYRDSGRSMASFRMHDGMDPGRLTQYQQLLDEAGYGTDRDGNIFVDDLADFSFRPRTEVVISDTMDDDWLDGFLTMNGTADAQRDAARIMLKNISYPIAAAAIIEDGKMSACGLGVMERGYVGLYDIYVDSSQRRRGLGTDICAAIMHYGKDRGCHTAYLQVLSDNPGARTRYRKRGSRETYEYWFRLKRF